MAQPYFMLQVPSLPAHLHDPNGVSGEQQFFDYMQISLAGIPSDCLRFF